MLVNYPENLEKMSKMLPQEMQNVSHLLNTSKLPNTFAENTENILKEERYEIFRKCGKYQDFKNV